MNMYYGYSSELYITMIASESRGYSASISEIYIKNIKRYSEIAILFLIGARNENYTLVKYSIFNSTFVVQI